MKFKSDKQRKAVMASMNGNNSRTRGVPNSVSCGVNMESRNTIPLTNQQDKRYKSILNNTTDDKIGVRELELHLDNSRDVYNQKVAIVKNLDIKRRKGIYNSKGGVLAFKNVATNARKSYDKECGFSGLTSKYDNALAIEMEKDYKNGNFRGLY